MASSVRPRGALSSKELERETARMEAQLAQIRATAAAANTASQKGTAPTANAGTPSSRWEAASTDKGPLRAFGRASAAASAVSAPSPLPPAGVVTRSTVDGLIASMQASLRAFPASSATSGPVKATAPASTGTAGGALMGARASVGGPPARPGSAARRPSTAGRRGLIPAEAPKWSGAQVSEWLGVLGLDKYQPLFAEHEITGDALVDITASDLDYLGVKPLAHRKLLLKGVENLRTACGLPPLASPPPASPPAITAAVHEDGAAVGGEVKGTPSRQPAVVHWSHLAPLPEPKSSSTGVAAGTNASVVTGAAGSDDVWAGEYDEAGQAAAFREAVMAWRRSNGSADAHTSASAASAAYSKQANASGGAAAGAGGGGGLSSLLAAGGDVWQNPFDMGTSAAPPAEEHVNLAEGEYNEAAQRAAFQQAVQEWRQRGTNGATESKLGSEALGAQTARPSRDGLVSPAPAATTADSTGTELRVSCYHCFKVFNAGSGFRVQRDEAEVDAVISGVNLVDRNFCSQRCYDAARVALATLQAELAAAAAQAEAAVTAAAVSTVPAVATHDVEAGRGAALLSPTAEYAMPDAGAAEEKEDDAGRRLRIASGDDALNMSLQSAATFGTNRLIASPILPEAAAGTGGGSSDDPFDIFASVEASASAAVQTMFQQRMAGSAPAAARDDSAAAVPHVAAAGAPPTEVDIWRVNVQDYV